ncbi:MAG TPA: ornithine cyclodeaminase family protein [Acidobacteriota bacterium]|nr:ornithine cyclodeaminase family protein [Acidobacteriota bacterium]
MRFVTEEQVQKALPVRKCIEVLRDAFSREFINIPRYRLKSPNSLLHVMSASIPSLGIIGLKAYATTKSNASFVVLLFNEQTAELRAVLEADHLGQIRTGAASGLATDLLANPQSKIGAIFGSGYQAETQLLAIDAVRRFDEVRVFSPTPEKRHRFVESMQGQVDSKLREVSSGEECAANADVICTITSSREPVLKGAWLKPGCHVNAAGSNAANRREVDEEGIKRCSLVCVDHREQSKIEAGDLIGVISDWSSVYELSDLVSGKVKRSHPEDITFFKSNGVAVEDIAAAHFILQTLEDRAPHSPNESKK